MGWPSISMDHLLPHARGGQGGRATGNSLLKTCWQKDTILRLFRACENKGKGECHFFYWHWEQQPRESGSSLSCALHLPVLGPVLFFPAHSSSTPGPHTVRVRFPGISKHINLGPYGQLCCSTPPPPRHIVKHLPSPHFPCSSFICHLPNRNKQKCFLWL